MPDDTLQSQLNALMRPRMVCVCKRVPEARIREVVEAGADTFEEIQRRTNCSTGCGTCEGAVRGLLAKIRPTSSSDSNKQAN
ncbi:MAG: (2Fe-2S)-binding protein [Leptospirales bacterium]|jgi:bacterioferritin-associated ferredoxin